MPDPIVETTVYDPDRQPVTRVDGRGHPWQTVYDGHGRVWQTLDPFTHRQEVSYDNNGNATAQRAYDNTGALLAESGTVFDRLDRQVESRQWLWEGPPTTERPASARLVVSETTYDPASNWWPPAGEILKGP